MNEIKFRVFDNQEKEMSYVDLYWFEENFIREIKDIREDYVVMQYTGIKDRKGVEIYTGDILEKHIGNYKRGEVIFMHGMFCFRSIGAGIMAGSDIFVHEHSLFYREYDELVNYTVIGNIYQNPELKE